MENESKMAGENNKHGCIRMYSDIKFACLRLAAFSTFTIARNFPLCLSFGWCIFETKLGLNIVGGHQNHYNHPVATPD